MIRLEEALLVVDKVDLEVACILRLMTLCSEVRVRVEVVMVEPLQVRDMIQLDQAMDRREVLAEDLLIHLVDLETTISSERKGYVDGCISMIL